MESNNNISFKNVTLENGFWLDRYNLNKNISIDNVKKRFEETGRFEALRFSYLKKGLKPHVFYDSDVAKWIEAIAYLIIKDRESMQEYEKFIDDIILRMNEAQMENGYINSYFQQIAPDKIYTNRNNHELYCTGHLIEAAIAYDNATGKDMLLKIMCKQCDYIYKVFVIDKTAAFITPGHPEIELALYKLYKYTNNLKYFELSRFFLEQRGLNKEQNVYYENLYGSQDDTDIYHLKEANGHCVRALYFYCGVADLCNETKDDKLFKNLDCVCKDIINTKMYITGGVGSTYRTESFTISYDLPNSTAYSESCAAISMIMFMMRMRKISKNAKYGNVIERIMYNSLLSSVSLDGKSFFYENPLEINLNQHIREKSVPNASKEHLPITQRVEVFNCSCCPPNINRMIAEIGDVICFFDDKILCIEQFIASTISTSYGNIIIKEDYIHNGIVKISCENYSLNKICIRIPEWCTKLDAKINNIEYTPEIINGYAYFNVHSLFTIELNFNIRPVFISSNPLVYANSGRIALTYGPLVYCLEGVDNGENLNSLSVPIDSVNNAKLFRGIDKPYSIKLNGYKDNDNTDLYFKATQENKAIKELVFQPYYTFANRGETDMLIWVRKA